MCGGTREALAIRRTPLALAGCRWAYEMQCTSLEDPEWNITARDRGPTGTAHSADPRRPNWCRPMAESEKNEHKSLKNSTLLQRQALLAKQVSPVCARYTMRFACFCVIWIRENTQITTYNEHSWGKLAGQKGPKAAEGCCF